MLPFHVDPPISPWPVLAACVLVGCVVGWGIHRGWRVEAPRLAALLLLILGVAVGVDRFTDLGQPLDVDKYIQRVLIGRRPLMDLLTHHYPDSRHPPLFYLLLHPISHLGGAAMRLVAVMSGLAAIGLQYLLARRFTDDLAALVPTALMAASVLLLFESRQISDLPLFMALSLAAAMLLAEPEGAEAPRLLGYSVVVGAMWWTWYLTPLLLLTHLVVIRRHARPVAGRWLLAMGAGCLLAIPELDALWLAISGDLDQRAIAGSWPEHLWGAYSVSRFAEELKGVLVPTGPWPVLALLGVGVGAVRSLRGPGHPVLTWSLATLVVAAALMVFGVGSVRLQPYYLLFALPPLHLLGTAGAIGFYGERTWRPAWWLSGLAAASLLWAGVFHVIDYVAMMPSALRPVRGYDYAAVGRAVRDDARTVVVDASHLVTPVMYFGFPGNEGLPRSCEHDSGFGERCASGGDVVIALSGSGNRLEQGWQERTVEQLGELPPGSWWFLDDRRFDNAPLMEVVQRRCEVQLQTQRLQLWACRG